MRLLIAPRTHRHGRRIGAVRAIGLAIVAGWSLIAVAAAHASTPADVGSIGGGTFSAIVSLVGGENTIIVVATDAAGNSSTVTLTVFH